ncbi:MAG: 30S ribosomal protein S12 methylthiotransferase RimO [Bacteroidales bacterium]|jgi:ribosomal protein S12 methylthiotransferase|nr:30S ribosomal protein S12 methylthiotransferase RimO [Bacteroidales bacterium]
MSSKTRLHKPLIAVVTLGCPKNLVDSENLMGVLKAADMNVQHGYSRKADILIINTCGFIQDAKEESIGAILEAIEHKKHGRVQKVLVMGCLSQRYASDLQKEIPEVDKFYGVNDLKEIINDLNFESRHELYGERLLTTPDHYAYLKIAEGCDRTCSFCAIPLIRGKNISRSVESLLQEAKNLAARGVKELILIAQDLTWYGLDIYRKRMLAPLLSDLVKINGIEWIRLHYTYPAAFPVDVLDVMASEPKICKYLDIPFQHINGELLTAMRRGITKKETYDLIETIRNKIPGIALRTSLMVGYPGETKMHFQELMDFVCNVRFERLGVFIYSEEEGTKAASLKNNIPKLVKQERADQIMMLQQEISAEINNAKIGKVFNTIIDGNEGEYYFGRTQYDSPEIDNEVLIHAAGSELEIGSFYNVLIKDSAEFDLYGEVTDNI